MRAVGYVGPCFEKPNVCGQIVVVFDEENQQRPSFSPNALPRMKIVPHARTLDPDPDDFWIFCSPSNDIPRKLCDIEKLGRFHRFAEFRQVLCFEIQAAGFFNASLSCKMQSYREHLFYNIMNSRASLRSIL